MVVQSNDYSESSDKYEEDFDSMSRSQTGVSSSILPSPHQLAGGKQPNQKQQAFDYKPVEEYKSNLTKYVKKENKLSQTDEGKYAYMNAADIEPSSYKEWTLTQNLKDAESLIQELKSQQAEIR